jgi:hypothetical protein
MGLNKQRHESETGNVTARPGFASNNAPHSHINRSYGHESAFPGAKLMQLCSQAQDTIAFITPICACSQNRAHISLESYVHIEYYSTWVEWKVGY